MYNKEKYLPPYGPLKYVDIVKPNVLHLNKDFLFSYNLQPCPQLYDQNLM